MFGTQAKATTPRASTPTGPRRQSPTPSISPTPDSIFAATTLDLHAHLQRHDADRNADRSDHQGTVTETYTINIPSIVGGSTAYIGFTGADGSLTSVQDILNWTYSSTSSGPTAPAAPTA